MITSLHQRQLMQRWRANHPQYMRKYGQAIRLRALSRVDPKLKCVDCGCPHLSCIEINHINGGGYKEKQQRHAIDHKVATGKRTVKDLNLKCRVCNARDHLERKLDTPLPYLIKWTGGKSS